MNPLVITPTFTPRDSVAFKIYLSEIERLPLISPNKKSSCAFELQMAMNMPSANSSRPTCDLPSPSLKSTKDSAFRCLTLLLRRTSV